MRPLLTLGLSLMGLVLSVACLVTRSSFTTLGADHNFAAEIENHSDTAILTHGIEVDFLDANGNVVDSKTTLGCLRSLQPGASDFVEAATAHPGAVSARAHVIAGETFRTGKTIEAGMGLSAPVVTRASSGTATGRLRITGTIRNDDTRTFVSPGVCLVLRAKDGTVLRANSLLTGAAGSAGLSADLAPGHSAQFTWEMLLPSDGPAPARVDAYADAFIGGVPTIPAVASSPVP